MHPTPGIALAALLVACTQAPAHPGAATGAHGDAATAIEGMARDSKASAVLVASDGRVIHVSGLSGWPAGIEDRPVRLDGHLVRATRLPRAELDADGAWSQGVASDSAPEWWMDEPSWTLIGAVPEPAPWTLTIADGSGNVTTLSMARDGTDGTWRYEPVDPPASSSGEYSGGDPASGVLPARQVAPLWSLVWVLESSTANHAAERNMGTVQITVESPGGQRRTILRAGSTTDLETFIAGLGGC